MLNLPVIAQQKLILSFRTEVLEDLEQFVAFAKDEGNPHASADNVVTYMLEKYFRSTSADLVAYRSWVAQAPQRAAEAAEAAQKSAEAVQRAKALLSQRAKGGQGDEGESTKDSSKEPDLERARAIIRERVDSESRRVSEGASGE